MNGRALLVSPLGFLIGVSLGALGGGGSILAVPILVYAAGESPQAATTTSLIVVGAASLFGMFTHLRAGRVRVRARSSIVRRLRSFSGTEASRRRWASACSWSCLDSGRPSR